MSLVASRWAWKHATRTPSEKLVLLCLADAHNERSGQCNPSFQTIADLCGSSRRHVIRIIESLIEQGLIAPSKRRGVTSMYELNLAFQGALAARNTLATGDIHVTSAPETSDAHVTSDAPTSDIHVTSGEATSDVDVTSAPDQLVTPKSPVYAQPVTPTSPTSDMGVTRTGMNLNTSGQKTGGLRASARDPGGCPTRDRFVSTDGGGGWRIDPDWQPSETVLTWIRMHGGIPPEFAADPARVAAFVMHFGQALSQQPTWDAKYRHWVQRDWADRHRNQEQADASVTPPTPNRFLALLGAGAG